MSAQKALQGSETETRVLLKGAKEKNIFPEEGSVICPPGKSMIPYKKVIRKKFDQWPDLSHETDAPLLEILIVSLLKMKMMRNQKGFLSKWKEVVKSFIYVPGILQAYAEG